MLQEFRAFIARGNVMDLAVAVIMGAAFGRIVSTLVDGVLMPPLGLITGRVDFSSLFHVLDTSKGMPASLAEAKAQGIPVIAYGQFINDVIAFLIVAFSVFLVLKPVNRMMRAREQAPATSRDCPFCATAIPLKATRCPYCTSEVSRS